MIEVGFGVKEARTLSPKADFLSLASPEILLGQTVNIEDLEQLIASKAEEVVIKEDLDRKVNRGVWLGMACLLCVFGTLITGGGTVLAQSMGELEKVKLVLPVMKGFTKAAGITGLGTAYYYIDRSYLRGQLEITREQTARIRTRLFGGKNDQP